MERKVFKDMLLSWERIYSGRTENILKGLKNISRLQLLDLQLFNFDELKGVSCDKRDADAGGYRFNSRS